jgi:hypothetical protein
MKMTLATLGTEARPLIQLSPETEAEKHQLEHLLKHCFFPLAHEVQRRPWEGILSLRLFLEKSTEGNQ